MLAFHYTPSSSPNCTYTPAIPSPLSPRSANIYGHSRGNLSHMSDPNAPSKATPNTQRRDISNDENQSPSQNPVFQSSSRQAHCQTAVPFSQRPIKRAPIPQKPDEIREKRRNNFLRRVSAQRDDRRYESRGEDIMRMDFMQRQRAWEAERRREADILSSQQGLDQVVEEEDDLDLPGWSGDANEEVGVEEFLRDEQAELEQLLEYMPDDKQQNAGEDGMWSDDADYDELFEEVLASQKTQDVVSTDAHHYGGEFDGAGSDEMDMS